MNKETGTQQTMPLPETKQPEHEQGPGATMTKDIDVAKAKDTEEETEEDTFDVENNYGFPYSEIMPLPPLEMPRSATIPGAVAVNGVGGRSFMSNNWVLAEEGWNNSPVPALGVPQQSPRVSAGNTSTGLVEARRVCDTREGLPRATEVRATDTEPKPRCRLDPRNVCAFFVLTISALALGLSFGLGRTEDPSPGHALHVSSIDSSTNTTSLLLSLAPSAAPTEPLDNLRQELPNYTLAALETFGTPQWLAMDWLGRHPDIYTMEDWRKKQLFALGTIFHSLGGPQWKEEAKRDWMLNDLDECYWFSSKFTAHSEDVVEGLSAIEYDEHPDPCNQNGEFVALYLARVDASGSLPPEVELLPSLAVIVLARLTNDPPRDISEVLPTQLRNLQHLEALQVGPTNSIGAFPSLLLDIKSLKYLAVIEMSLSGTIPTGIGSLSSLELLRIYGCNLTGTIATEFGLLSNLKQLHLYNNLLSGTLPTELVQVSSLERIVVHLNRLTGTIQTEIFSLPNLEEVSIDSNSFTGTIPSEIGKASLLQIAGLQLNSLTGTVPTEVFSLPYLGLIGLAANPITGVLPSEVGMLPHVQGMDFSYTGLTGSIPSELGLAKTLAGLSLEGSGFTGSIPPELFGLSNLNVLALGRTGLTGSFPTDFGKLPYFQGLYLMGTRLSGSIPSELGQLPYLGVLDLSNMPLLTGSIPQELSSLNFDVVKLGGSTQLTGTVPEQFCSIGAESCPLSGQKYWWLEYRIDTTECILEFGCSDTLCGCDCDCPATAVNGTI
ncbi:receptor-like protein kinase [Seminavis robusta]|uniref:non-specific serine/threonine protein kinase n=1 Tax=Seminavis robusta TaxID=568900 RepID=A0A9N8ERU1_9STRA|nr:receptor-like protein kinase [Seminavis robusta]|eukprot:Sro1771_g296650.1 receptor-like protein kinase (777) ;mRNA; f:15727-18057